MKELNNSFNMRDSTKYSFHDNSKAFIFGIDGITNCSKEKNNLIFDKNFNISSFELDDFFNLLNEDYDLVEYKTLFAIKKNEARDIYYKLITSISLALYTAENPLFSFALSSSNLDTEDNVFEDTIEKLGDDIFKGVSNGVIKGIIIVTALRIFVEVTRGSSKYKFVEIIKQCAIAILIVIILPALPGIINLMVERYLPSY